MLSSHKQKIHDAGEGMRGGKVGPNTMGDIIRHILLDECGLGRSDIGFGF